MIAIHFFDEMCDVIIHVSLIAKNWINLKSLPTSQKNEMDGNINPILCDTNDFKEPSSRNAICHHFAKAPIKLK
jgi:hypothetical protein